MRTVSIASAGGETRAELVPAAGMLCSSLTHAGAQLLDRRRGLQAYVERGSTMGIPLLYPWANRLGRFGYVAAGKEVQLPDDGRKLAADPHGLPIHGVLPRFMGWKVKATATQEGRVNARLAWSAPELLALFPYEHEAECEITVGDGELTITTRVRATGADHVPVSFGYHPYLRLPGTLRAQWRVELPQLRRLVLDERMLPTGERSEFATRELQLGEQSWDDAFELGDGPRRFAVSAGECRIELELLAGYRFAQIYAPPDRDVICFEPMTAPTNALCSGDGLIVLAPGGEHSASFTVRAHI